ncbi:nuclear transport factor 2 family protein [Fodinicola acaciae]|uniref:nuclear transport factor 2 family protein n=1 Tax=Fodinicola acaciae TaxID=2681555 RepID=UPI0013D18BDF|nr:nuclear transport factor 2 family protein [Fodinicola acaciae]
MSDDEQKIGRLVTDLYATISGPAGPRDWDRLRTFLHPDGRLMRTSVDQAGNPAVAIMSVDDYVDSTAAFLSGVDFYEVETSRRIDVFGNMAHVWSAYEARHTPAGPAPERKGINSIQLFRDQAGDWHIMNMIWDNERPNITLGEPVNRDV